MATKKPTKKSTKKPAEDLTQLSTIALLRRLGRKAEEYGASSPVPFGCVVCGDGSRLLTHEVPGYGGVCAPHAEDEGRAKPLPWAAEGAELTRRGLVL